MSARILIAVGVSRLQMSSRMAFLRLGSRPAQEMRRDGRGDGGCGGDGKEVGRGETQMPHTMGANMGL